MKEKIIEYLKNKYKPIAIILYGSHASNNATPQSDWDFAVFVDYEAEGETEIIGGQAVDADIVKLPTTKEELIKQFDGTFQTAKLVFDTNNIAKNLLDSVQDIYKLGRNLNEREKLNRINFITRRLRKLEDNLNNPGVFFFHLGVFFEKAIQYYFELKNNKWRLSPGTALRVIEEDDPKYFELVKILYENASASDKLIAAKKIYSIVTTSEKT